AWFFFFSSRRRHTRCYRDWSSDVCSSDLQRPRADWTKFGLGGSISTPEACADAGGTFMPSIFGWMVHLYPYEESRQKIWGHSMRSEERRVGKEGRARWGAEA